MEAENQRLEQLGRVVRTYEDLGAVILRPHRSTGFGSYAVAHQEVEVEEEVLPGADPWGKV